MQQQKKKNQKKESCSSYFDSISMAITSNSDTTSPVNDWNNNGLLDSRA
ncbi:MAG: hypothetical protein WA421_19400 [Nitrososphaeraceae archaeon]